jgi:hypothetical protein
MSKRERPAVPKNRRRRARPTPRWLMKTQDLDEMARRRCLLILSVLSGEKPVSAAIEEAQISRQLYYDLESRALAGMLAAMMPTHEGPAAATPAARIAELEKQVHKLEQEKRRSERLLLLTRQMIKPGSVKRAPGRPRKQASKGPGRKPSKSSVTKSPSPSSTTSILTKDGEAAR